MQIIAESINRAKWSEFVSSHRNGNIFQTADMFDVYKKTKNYTPVALFALDDSENITALSLGVIIQETGKLLSSFTSRCVVQGGPLYENADDVASLIEKHDDVVHKRAIYTQLRNLWDIREIRNLLDNTGYVYEDHLNYMIDLNRSEEEIWRDIHKSRRKGIKRAQRDNIVIKKIQDSSELYECYELIRQTYQNAKLPVADISLFRAAYEILVPKNLAEFYIALKDGEPAGTRMVLKYNGTVHDWYAGSKKDVMYVDEALVWRILQDNAGKYRFFEFGGAGHPDKEYGVREFKKRFGGKEVNFGRYVKVHNTWRKNVVDMVFNIYRKVG